VDGFARLEDQAVEQEGGEHARVAGVRLAEFEDGAAFEVELAVLLDVQHAGVEHLRQQEVQRGLRERDQRGEQGSQALRVRLAREEFGVGREVRCVQRAQQRGAAVRVAEARQRVELGQCADQLGLRRRVLVVAGRRVHRDARPLLRREPRRGLLGRRVGLEAQCLLGGEDLHQERQPAAPAGGEHGAQLADRVLGERFQQRPFGAVRTNDPRRVAGVGTHPQLGLGVLRRNGLAEQF
jgi:hypothetical protein